jgi:protein-tyrosine phosphatase
MKRSRFYQLLAILPALAAFQASAALVPVSPTCGETVALLPDAQKKVMNLPTLAERIALFREDREKGGNILRRGKFWRKANQVVLIWRTTDGETGPWKVEIARDSGFEDADVRYLGKDAEGLSVDGDTFSFTVPRANLEIGRKYYWRVTGLGKPEKGRKKGAPVRSEAAAFATEDRAPRWIEIEGRSGNIRDIGGWRTADGRRVLQGMAFRGKGLNDNSVTGERQGPNRLTVEDVKYFTQTLGIRTDLDLRTKAETADLDESPLGPGVNLIMRSSPAYRGIFEKGRKTSIMAENIRVFCDRANYPIYFHCIGGADRTGSLAYVLLGVLGVSQHDIETDWESTFYPNIPDDINEKDPNFWCRESHLTDGIAKYGDEGDTWQRRCELYLLDCGVTKEEIARLREILLEPAE